MSNGLFQDVYRQILQQQQQRQEQPTRYGSGWDAITKAHAEIASSLGKSLAPPSVAKKGMSENQKRATKLFNSLETSKDINAINEGIQELKKLGSNKSAAILNERVSKLEKAQKRIKPLSKNIEAIEKITPVFKDRLQELLAADISEAGFNNTATFMQEAQEAGLSPAIIEKIIFDPRAYVDEGEKQQNILERWGVNKPEKIFDINRARALMGVTKVTEETAIETPKDLDNVPF